jgi:16S rRNA G966 N2-methylase RsmD
MIEQLLQQNVQKFIEQHAQEDEQQLLLKHKIIFDIQASTIVWQISGRKKAKTKIPLYFTTPNILYPPGINLEQSSSEETATFKAFVLSNALISNDTLIDLTGGFGIDSLFFSKIFKRINYIEPNAELLKYAKHNHQVLGADNIEYSNSTSEDFLNSFTGQADCFFIDPSRRTTSNQKVFKLDDCEPNVVKLLSQIFEHSKTLLVKVAPLLDLQQGLLELKTVKNIWVVSVKNEVKELLFLCEKDFQGDPVTTAVNLSSDHETFSFKLSDEKSTQAEFSDPLIYTYEPNASILKAGAFKTIAKRFSLHKLHPSTHLYTSERLINSFPGRIFKTKALLKADVKSAASHFPDGKANVITRNYPLTPDELKKKLKLQDGGDKYLIGCSGEKQKFLIAAERLK